MLRYDKRTRVHANLMRDLAGRTVKDETIDDALAAVQVLGRTPGVDPNRVFVPGHSLGGLLLPAEYYTPGHVSENVVHDIAAWIMGVAPRRQ